MSAAVVSSGRAHRGRGCRKSGARAGLPAGTCFVGIDFYRPQGEASTVRAAVAQAFAENGDAFILRGNEFHWDAPNRSPHLPAEHVQQLIASVRAHYERHHRRAPRHVVIHKPSYCDSVEREAFQDALSDLEYDLVSVRPANKMRLLRNGEYPPQRGTVFRYGTAPTCTLPGPWQPQAFTPTVTCPGRSRPRTTSATAPMTDCFDTS